MIRPKKVEHNAHYSRFVHFMKIILPSIAAIFVSMVIIWPQLSTQTDETVKAATKNGSLSKGTDLETLKMTKGRFFSTDNKNQPYTITYEEAKETKPGSRTIQLIAPNATLYMKDGYTIKAAAESGIYRHNNSELALTGDVTLNHNEGHSIKSNKILIHLKDGIAKSENPIVAEGTFGSLTASGFIADKNKKNIVFKGKAKLILNTENFKQ
ncbi:MAG: LPS export ABC transporter periplasmic protein LptC [Alphaproteobacteria bacterium]|nr:LPS export ABC transporter periplasmic protein LptC [Alphaproteobacteria bacterium]